MFEIYIPLLPFCFSALPIFHLLSPVLFTNFHNLLSAISSNVALIGKLSTLFIARNDIVVSSDLIVPAALQTLFIVNTYLFTGVSPVYTIVSPVTSRWSTIIGFAGSVRSFNIT